MIVDLPDEDIQKLIDGRPAAIGRLKKTLEARVQGATAEVLQVASLNSMLRQAFKNAFDEGFMCGDCDHGGMQNPSGEMWEDSTTKKALEETLSKQDPFEVAQRFLVVIHGGVEPSISGPYRSAEEQFVCARTLTKQEDTVLWVDSHMDGSISTGSYTHDELSGEEASL
jgi:hypothetical protein